MTTIDAQAQRRETARLLARTPYERAIHMCLQCGIEGENRVGKKYDRNRFCSDECMEAFEPRKAQLAEDAAQHLYNATHAAALPGGE